MHKLIGTERGKWIWMILILAALLGKCSLGV